jgi:hypothetical protein
LTIEAAAIGASLRDTYYEFPSRVLSGIDQVRQCLRRLRQVIRASYFDTRFAFRGTTSEIFQIAVSRRQLNVMNAHV